MCASPNLWAAPGELRPLDANIASQLSVGMGDAVAPKSSARQAPRQGAPLAPMTLNAGSGAGTSIRGASPTRPQSTGSASITTQSSRAVAAPTSSGSLKPMNLTGAINSAVPSALPTTGTSHLMSELPEGKLLSEALGAWVAQRGWQLKWSVGKDYVIDVGIPIPSEDVIEAVNWVIRAYQSQGGLLGVAPDFHRSNNVVSIKKMDAEEKDQ